MLCDARDRTGSESVGSVANEGFQRVRLFSRARLASHLPVLCRRGAARSVCRGCVSLGLVSRCADNGILMWSSELWWVERSYLPQPVSYPSSIKTHHILTISSDLYQHTLFSCPVPPKSEHNRHRLFSARFLAASDSRSDWRVPSADVAYVSCRCKGPACSVSSAARKT